MQPDLSVKVDGHRFEHPIINGAGLIKTIEQVREICETALSAIVIGSITVSFRPGNEGSVYGGVPGVFSLNSLGIPNPGLEYYRDRGMLKEMIQIVHDKGKIAIVNVAGFSVEDFVVLTEVAYAAGADIVDENFGCPNIVKNEGQTLVQKPVISYDLNFCDLILIALRAVADKVWIKGSPFSNPLDRKKFAALPASHSIVTGLVSTNTFPNASAFNEDGRLVTTPANGFAGYAGPGLKPIALAHVREYSQLLPNVAHIGAGGVSSGRDVLDYIRAGAKLTKIVTALLDPDGKHRYDRISEILESYVDIIASQGSLKAAMPIPIN